VVSRRSSKSHRKAVTKSQIGACGLKPTDLTSRVSETVLFFPYGSSAPLFPWERFSRTKVSSPKISGS
jgi:hypothetical protein